jgi:hypothetical protein
LFQWQRFSDVIHRHITAAGLRYRYPRKPKLNCFTIIINDWSNDTAYLQVIVEMGRLFFPNREFLFHWRYENAKMGRRDSLLTLARVILVEGEIWFITY